MRRVVLAILMVCMATAAVAQQQLERDQVSGTSGQVLTYNVKLAAPAFTFEYILTGTPGSSSIVLQGCMRGGTCETIETNTSTSNTKRSVIGVYDYFTFSPTLSGGSSPKLQVNVTGMVAATIPSAANAATQTVNLGQVGGTAVVTGGVNGSQGVGGLAATGATPAGNPLYAGGKDLGLNQTYPIPLRGTGSYAVVLPLKDTAGGATPLFRNYSGNHITTNATTTPTAATAYITACSISVTAAGTTETLVIKDKQGTAQTLYQSGTLVVGSTFLNFSEPILMTSGIDIVTAGSGAATVDVKCTYWQ